MADRGQVKEEGVDVDKLTTEIAAAITGACEEAKRALEDVETLKGICGPYVRSTIGGSAAGDVQGDVEGAKEMSEPDIQDSTAS